MSSQERLLLVVNSIANEALKRDGDGWKVSPEFVGALAEAVRVYASGPLMEDLTAFSIHAKRRTITAEDVRLVARKSSQLVTRIDMFIDEATTTGTSDHKSTAAAAASKRKKTKTEEVLMSEDDAEVDDDEFFND